MIYALILHLDAPLQSWGINSRFQLRSAGFAPSKSAICGMVCAACGAPKESSQEQDIISHFQQIKMDCFCLRNDGVMVDFHTVQNFRRATGEVNTKEPVLTHRHYWQSSRYNVILRSNDKDFLSYIRSALLNPVWGIWLGRKCCIPAVPIIQEGIMDYTEARQIAAEGCLESYTEVDDFESGTDTWYDQPQGFGKLHSSGREGRVYAPRRLNHDYSQNSSDQSDFFNF